MKGQQYEAAVSELGRAAQLDPNSAEYALGLGEALLRWRHDPVALQYLLAVQTKFAKVPLYEFELGLAYYYLTQYPLALKEFENVAQEQPKSSQVQYLLGGTYQALGELDKAEDCFRKAIALKPDEASYYLVLASLLKKVHPADLAEPVGLSEKGLALSPDNVDLKLLLASCYQTQGRLAEAQALLEAVVTSDPDFRAAHVALAQVYFRQKRVKDAEQQESIAAKLEERKQSEISPWGPGASRAPEIPDAIIEKGSRGASRRTHENK
jgi:cytochrome c-type biogenesis protein CcmH/NrfG